MPTLHSGACVRYEFLAELIGAFPWRITMLHTVRPINQVGNRKNEWMKDWLNNSFRYSYRKRLRPKPDPPSPRRCCAPRCSSSSSGWGGDLWRRRRKMRRRRRARLCNKRWDDWWEETFVHVWVSREVNFILWWTKPEMRRREKSKSTGRISALILRSHTQLK